MPTDAARWEPASPFGEVFVTDRPVAPPRSAMADSPFLQEYEGDDGAAVPRVAELYADIVSELADEEFDDAVHELVDEVSDLAMAHPSRELDEAHEDRVENMLREHLEPLAKAAEELADSVGTELEGVDLDTATESEIEEAFDRAAPDAALASPAFEHFWKKLKKKFKGALKAGVKLAKKGIQKVAGPLIKAALAKLGAFVRPLLNRVLKMALDKVPERYRPIAEKVAARLGIKTKAADAAPAQDSGAEPAEPDATPLPQDATEPTQLAAPAVEDVQEELDAEIAEMLLMPDGIERETPFEGETTAARDPYLDLDRARDRFAREIFEASDDPERTREIIENFLPAAMLAVRLATKLAGRSNVVSMLSKGIAPFLAPVAGKEGAAALARVLADIGLKTFLQAEVGFDDTRAVSGEMLASAVEDTVRRVASLPEEVLDQPELFEAFAHEAFEASVAANFPSQLIKPELRETEARGVWALRPRRGKKMFKRFTTAFEVDISPQVAAAVQSYDGTPLSAFFRDRLRLPVGATIKTRVHLYEALPRTRLARIARSEGVRGLGSSDPSAWTQLHPLTPDAAGLLLGAPKLGRALSPDAERQSPRIGERYYFLEIDEAPRVPLGRESHVHLTANYAKNELRVCLYLSEVAAQRVASILRKRQPVSAALTELRTALAGPSKTLVANGARRRVRVVRPRVAVTRALRRKIAARALQWSWVRLAEFLQKDAAAFLAAVDGPEDGARIGLVFQGALERTGNAPRGAKKPAPEATITVKAGPKHD